MKSAGFARTALLWLVGIVAVSAIGGGVTLTLASVVPSMPESLMPPADELVGSPFTSYLIPGLVLLALGIVPLPRSPVRLAADDGSPRPADSDGA